MRPTLSIAIAAACIAISAPASAATDPGPQIVYLPVAQSPAVADGLKVACFTDGSAKATSEKCPVIEYQGVTAWPCTFFDNRDAMIFALFDNNNKNVGFVARHGARNLWRITSQPDGQSLTLTGEANRTLTLQWAYFKESDPAKALRARQPDNSHP